MSGREWSRAHVNGHRKRKIGVLLNRCFSYEGRVTRGVSEKGHPEFGWRIEWHWCHGCWILLQRVLPQDPAAQPSRHPTKAAAERRPTAGGGPQPRPRSFFWVSPAIGQGPAFVRLTWDR